MNKKILYIGNDLAKKSGYYTSMETFSSNIKLDGFEVIKYSNKKNKIFRLFHMCIGLIKHKNSVDYVLIDTFSSFSFYYCLIVSQLCRIFKKKYIPILRGGKLPSRINKSIFFSKIIFKNAYKNIAPSYYLKSEFESNGYLVEYIPNILEIDRYQFKKRNQLQVKLLWVRAFKHLYNPNLAIDVILLLKEKFPKLKLCMIGPVKDDSFQKVSTRVFEENLQENVEFTGVLSKQDWHKKSEEFDIFINTTNFDNTPVSVMEAMALGLPIVSTNVGGMPFLIENGKDGLLVEKENAKSMSNAIEKIIENDVSEMITNARKKAESFSWQIVKNEWLKILS